MKTSLITKVTLIAGSLILGSTAAQAEWTGQGEAGFVTASGNTDTENLNIGLNFLNDGAVWDHEFGIIILNASNDGDDTAESIAADYIAKRDLTPRSFLFGGVGYLDDDFDGFTEQTSVSVGYGYRFIDTEPVGLEAGIGIGYRDTSELLTLEDGSEIEGDDLSGETLVLTFSYRNQFTSNTQFLNNFRAEIGSDNTYLENDAALLVSMNEKFALKLGLLIRQNTDAPVGTDETDTITSANLVYNF